MPPRCTGGKTDMFALFVGMGLGPPLVPHPHCVSLRYAQELTRRTQVAGAQGTGKTSLLRLILDTADISPTATADQKAAMERFLRGAPKRTDAIQTACVEICESKYDRLLLSVIDTPGLDFQEGHELKLERQVSTVVKYLDAQFADTLSEVRPDALFLLSPSPSVVVLCLLSSCRITPHAFSGGQIVLARTLLREALSRSPPHHSTPVALLAFRTAISFTIGPSSHLNISTWRIETWALLCHRLESVRAPVILRVRIFRRATTRRYASIA